jgi:DNA topoisomerase I
MNHHTLYLVLVESPNKVRKIQSILGNHYHVMATCGHLCTLPNLQHIDMKHQFQCTYEIISSKSSIIQKLGTTIALYPPGNIFIATDQDREGEAIAFHLCRMFHLSMETTKRIVFNEITQEAILRAIEPTSIRTIDMNLVKSQQARQIVDILIGFQISPLLWKYLYAPKQQHALSAGRCQTPALRLIYDNYIAKQKETRDMYYRTTGHFLSAPLTFKATLSNHFSTLEECQTFLTMSTSHLHTMEFSKETRIFRSPPKPFNTSTILQYASRYMHISSHLVMSLLQSLYQDGYITYLRTESHKYSEEFLQKAFSYIETQYSPQHVASSTQQKELSNQHDSLPHEAIRITNIQRTSIHVKNPQLSTLYRLIWKHTIASCMNVATLLKYELTISAPSVSTPLCYHTCFHVPIFRGWMDVQIELFDKESDTIDDIMDNTNLVHYLKSRSSTISYEWIDCQVIEKGTKITHYNEAKLIHTLETLQIGRPSTYTKFVETMLERNYVTCKDIEGRKETCTELILRKNEEIETSTHVKCFGAEKRVLVLQPIGLMCIEFLLTHFHTFFDYEYSKQIEYQLDTILHNDTWYHICEETQQELLRLIQPISYREEKQVFQLLSRTEFERIQEKGSNTPPLSSKDSILYTLAFQHSGPYVQKKQGNKIIDCLPIKQEISLETILQKRTWLLQNISSEKQSSETKHSIPFVEDLVEYMSSTLGEYEGKQISRKCGPYGYYLEWGNEKYPFHPDKEQISIQHITWKEAIQYFRKDSLSEKTSNLIRTIDQDASVRTGPYGMYIYYQTSTMKRPKFISLKSFSEDPSQCDLSSLQEFLQQHKMDKKKSYSSHGKKQKFPSSKKY